MGSLPKSRARSEAAHIREIPFGVETRIAHRPASDGFQQVRKIGGGNKRVFVLGAPIFDGGEHG